MKPPRTHGGKRDNAGRPPDWLKEKCKSLIDKNNLLEFVSRVANGEERQTVVVKNGPNESFTEEIPCDTKDRLRAVEMLLDRGFGKPAQALEVGGADGGPLTIQVVQYAVKK